jgi:hypothetical protein
MRRREAFWNNVSMIIGCCAIVAIIAAVILVLTQHMMRPPLADPGMYAEMAMEDARTGPGWSGDTAQNLSMFERTKGRGQPTPVAPRLASSATGTTPTAPAPAAAAPPTAAVAVPVTTATMADLSIAPPKAIPAVSGIENIDQKRDGIFKALTAFFDAKDVTSKLPFVRDPERVRALMHSFYSREPMPSFRLRDIGKMARLDERGYRFGYVQALFEDATPASLLVEEDAEGQFRIDWESLVRYGELSWKDFLNMHPTDPKLMRLIASRPASPDAAGNTGLLELRHPVESGTILGTFDRNDPKYAPLVEQLEQRSWKDVPVTLRVCFPTPPSSTEKSNVQIAGVEGKGWVILEAAN